jgi:hypothetical protein
MKRILATLLLAASASTLVAQTAPASGRVMVEDPKHCPPQTTSVYANYRLQEGRFVRDGWVCDKIAARS